MDKEEIIAEVEFIPDEVLATIIDCCKELSAKGIPPFLWDREHIESLLDKVIES